MSYKRMSFFDDFPGGPKKQQVDSGNFTLNFKVY